MKQGQRGCCPFPLHPKSPLESFLRFAPDHRCLTIPNTYSTITMPASLRSDCCSPSLRNAVRLPSGISVHLHRNTQGDGLDCLNGICGPPSNCEQAACIHELNAIFLRSHAEVRDTDGLKQCNEGQRTASLYSSVHGDELKRAFENSGPECCALPDGAVGTYFHSICLKNSLSSCDLI